MCRESRPKRPLGFRLGRRFRSYKLLVTSYEAGKGRTVDSIAAARTRVDLWYNDRNISADVAPMLESFEYHSYATGQIDDISVTLKDPDDRWCNSWFPDKDARLRAEIVWSEGSDERRLPCGTFAVDSPSYGDDRITIKALAASASLSIRREAKAQQYRGVTLKQLATKIAARHAVKLIFVGVDTQPFGLLEQKDKADLPFLLQQCNQWGYCLKIRSNELVIYDQAEIDAQGPLLTIERRNGILIAGSDSFTEESVEQYRGCRVTYQHPDAGKLMAIYMPKGEAQEGPLLSVRGHVANGAEAYALAQATYENAVRDNVSGDVTVLGDNRLVAAVTVACSGWGRFDGVYTVDQADHTVADGWQTKLKLVKTMIGAAVEG